MKMQQPRGHELFPSPALSPRDRNLRQIKRSVMRLAMTGGRQNGKLARRIFKAAAELKEV